MMGLKLRFAGRTDIGKQREHNEDSLCILPEYNLFIVADGMGGHKAGDVASQLAMKSIADFFKLTENEDATWPFKFEPTLTTEENRLITGILIANQYIFQASVNNTEQSGMGTTVVSCIFSPEKDKSYIAHVGDSRCYRIKNKKIELLTQDHSLFNEYKSAMPHLSGEQLSKIPKHVITRALGMNDSVKVDIQSVIPEAGDLYILCSDGLSTMVVEDDLFKIVEENRADLQKTCNALIDKANENGGEDNITVIIIELISGG